MKKYWKLLVLSIVIALSIGTYYIQKAAAHNKQEQALKIEVVSGNKQELDAIVLKAEYGQGSLFKYVAISKDGSTRLSNHSMVRGEFASSVPDALASQVERYRSFMRGKDFFPNDYFEDEQRLIYVGWEEKSSQGPVTLVVDALDKKTEERTKFEVQSLSAQAYNWVTIHNVQAEQDEIKVLLSLQVRSGEHTLYTYTIDEQQTITHETMLGKFDNNTSLIIYNDEQSVKNDRYYVYAERKQVYEGSEINNPDSVQVYNTSTGLVETIALPTEVKSYGYDTIVEDSAFYILKHVADGVELYEYHFETKEWQQPIHFSYPVNVLKDERAFLQMLDGKLYSVYEMASMKRKLLVHDIQTGELLCEGNIVSTNDIQYFSPMSVSLY